MIWQVIRLDMRFTNRPRPTFLSTPPPFDIHAANKFFVSFIAASAKSASKEGRVRTHAESDDSQVGSLSALLCALHMIDGA